MPNLLKPHSNEWFKELEKINPKQAEHTRALISLAGKEDICSICGDEDSREYKLSVQQSDPSVISAIRLCEDCLQIRKQMHGEEFVPFID